MGGARAEGGECARSEIVSIMTQEPRKVTEASTQTLTRLDP